MHPKERKYKHFNKLRNNKHHSIYLQEAFNEYGFKSKNAIMYG